MSDAFIVRRGGNGKAASPYAAIAVSFPYGSECTCSNGTRTLKAGNKSGKYVFSIPENGEWTVQAGGKKSQLVTIDHEGQYEYVFLEFADEIFKPSEFEYYQNRGTVTISAADIKSSVKDTASDTFNYVTITSKNALDISKYTKLAFAFADIFNPDADSPTVGASSLWRCGVFSVKPSGNLAVGYGFYTYCAVRSNMDGIWLVDLSGLDKSKQYYIGYHLSIAGDGDGERTATLKSIRGII